MRRNKSVKILDKQRVKRSPTTKVVLSRYLSKHLHEIFYGVLLASFSSILYVRSDITMSVNPSVSVFSKINSGLPCEKSCDLKEQKTTEFLKSAQSSIDDLKQFTEVEGLSVMHYFLSPDMSIVANIEIPSAIIFVPKFNVGLDKNGTAYSGIKSGNSILMNFSDTPGNSLLHSIYKQATDLINNLKSSSIEVEKLDYVKHRGFTATLKGSAVYIYFGLSPFKTKISRLKSILDKAKVNAMPISIVELDYRSKAIIKL